MQTQLPASAVRDTLAAVFAQESYDRSVRETLAGRFWGWLGELLSELLSRLLPGGDAPPLVRWTVLGLLALVVLAAVWRVAYVMWARREMRRGGVMRQGRAAAVHGDPWTAAQQAAADGRFMDAAHLLYVALLQRLAGDARLRLHPSKTGGDYVRELRRASFPGMPTFRQFVRAYERLVYGRGACDRADYERLHTLARDVLGARGATSGGPRGEAHA
jgi:hypothetical protein